MNYKIRMGHEQDIKGLCAIRNNRELFLKYIRLQESNECYFVIAEQQDEVVGFGVLKLKGARLPKLSDLYVKESARGNGIGSELIKFRENIARNIGFSHIFVSVDPIENPKMINLINKHGYVAITKTYEKEAIYYNEDGTTYTKTYTRIDFRKAL